MGDLPAQGETTRIAVVDLESVVRESEAGKELQARLWKFQRDVQAEGEAMSESARQIRQRIVEGANSLSEDKLAQLQKDYEDATIAIGRFQEEKQRESKKMQQEGLRQIEKQLEPVLRRVRDEGDYDLILNKAAGVVVMASERIDITQKVIDLLNAAQSRN